MDRARRQLCARLACGIGALLTLAAEYPEYAEGAKHVNIVETTSGAYYGAGYQDRPILDLPPGKRLVGCKYV